LPGAPAEAAGVKLVWWSSNGVGADILNQFNQLIGKFADSLADGL